jgi:hypothetical protein
MVDAFFGSGAFLEILAVVAFAALDIVVLFKNGKALDFVYAAIVRLVAATSDDLMMPNKHILKNTFSNLAARLRIDV